MTEKEKLIKRLLGSKNFSVSWGPDAHLLTAEERCKIINDAFDQIDAGDCEVVYDFDADFGDSDRPQIDVRTLLE